jgi:hypothetical protein
LVSEEEDHAVLAEYARRHPLACRIFARASGYPLDGPEVMRREFASSLHLVTFCPRDIQS